MKENTKNWLKKAEEDIQTCELLKKNKFYPTSVVCFHCQQAAEKFLKAYLTEKDINFRKTHDLIDLLVNYIIPIDKEFEAIMEDCEYLTDYGVIPRYPGDYPDITEQEAKTAFEKALKIKNFVMKKLTQ